MQVVEIVVENEGEFYAFQIETSRWFHQISGDISAIVEYVVEEALSP